MSYLFLQEKKAKLEALEREEKQRQLDEQRARLEAKSPRGAPGDIAPLQPPLKFNTNSAPGTTTFGVAPAVAASAAVSAANTTPASSPLKPASMVRRRKTEKIVFVHNIFIFYSQLLLAKILKVNANAWKSG